MQDSHIPEDRPPFIRRDDKAEIVDRLYDVALDPIRLEDLLDVWELHVRAHRTGPVETAITLEDPEIEAHLRRATVFLDRFEATRDAPPLRSVLEDIPRSAAFLSDGGRVINGFNRPAAVAFGLSAGAGLADLPFGPDDISFLRDQIVKVASGQAERVVTLRMHSTISQSPVIMRVGPVDTGKAPKPMALIVSTELVWPEGFEVTVQEAFGLTLAEIEIVRGIALGLPVKDIATARGRSAETVRTQLRSILAKTETHSQSELVRVVLGLMDLAQLPIDGVAVLPTGSSLLPAPFQLIRARDGRRLEWLEFGDPQGAPLLYMHLDLGLTRWPASAERAAKLRGIRVIVPVRAGYGRSDLHAKGQDHIEGVAQDYLAILDHLAIKRCAILSMGADLRFALCLSLRRHGMVSGILGCSAQLPLRTSAQYDRMDKWQRFILANARYAPKVLPFLVQAGFSLARRLGKEKFFAQVNGGSAADMKAFAVPEVREAVLVGSEVALGAKQSAHKAFARECISSESDWSHLVRAVKVPVVLLQGDQDPQTPVATIRELMTDFPHLEVSFLPDCGQLLLFTKWHIALDRLGLFLTKP
jgi:pimeloyl-ACP methyl ester carboxylesterase/DNA-binding CsgD family transcriptional regulator